MKLLNALLRDESGAVLSSELVLVGTVGVVGATVGLSAIKKSVNAELVDVSRAIRSLDQSYCIEGTKGCGAWTAGSAFKQEPVEKSLKELDLHVSKLTKEEAAKAKQAAEKKSSKDSAKKPQTKRKPEPKKTPPKKRPQRRKKPQETEIIL